MSNTPFHSNQPFKPPASELNSDSPDIKPDEPIGETSFVGTDTQAENVGSPVEDDASKAADLMSYEFSLLLKLAWGFFENLFAQKSAARWTLSWRHYRSNPIVIEADGCAS